MIVIIGGGKVVIIRYFNRREGYDRVRRWIIFVVEGFIYLFVLIVFIGLCYIYNKFMSAWMKGWRIYWIFVVYIVFI